MQLPAPWYLPLFGGCCGRRALSCTRNLLIPRMFFGGSHSTKWLPPIHILNWVSSFPQAMGCCSVSAQKVAVEKVLPLDYSTLLLPLFFCLMAARLNESRCPGGRPSVSTNYITIEASAFCIEMTTVHAIYKHFFFCSTLLRCDLLAKKVPGRAPYSQHIMIRNWT